MRRASATLACLLFAATAFVPRPGITAGPRPIPASALWGERALQSVEVNPSGTHIAAHAIYDGTHGILVQEVETGAVDPVFRGKRNIDFGWVDDDTIVVSFQTGNGAQSQLIELTQEEYYLEYKSVQIRAKGLPEWQSLLSAIDNELLWSVFDVGQSSVYRVPTSELLDPKGSRRSPHSRYRVAMMSGRVISWVSDQSGTIRAALSIVGGDNPELVLRYRPDADSPWRDLGRWDDPEEAVRPVALAANQQDLLVLSRANRDFRALVEFRVGEMKLGKVIYANNSADVVDVLYDYNHSEVQAAIYEAGGLRRYYHLKDFGARQQRWLEQKFPDQSVMVTSLTLDRQRMTALVSGPRNPGTFVWVAPLTKVVKNIGEVMPDLDISRLVDVHTIEVESADGTPVEAFLALPKGKRPPLLVLPHGGPIAVRDDREFNPVVQYFGAAGFAVLTINYRGSEGYGRSFLDAGRRQWSKGIEDDIEAAAVDHVVSKNLVDPEHMCIIGASYGGYSALISVATRPGRYRCAASLNGPTDILLMFESSDFAATEEGRQRFAQIVGDPETETNHLVNISPAYRVAEIEIPVFIAHSTEDRRVDVEHAYRMRAMLEAHGKELDWMLLEDEPHTPGFEQYIAYINKLHNFVYRSLYE